MNTEISLLQAEISRLQHINRLLADRNIQLEAALSHHQSVQGDTPVAVSLCNNVQGDISDFSSPRQNDQSDTPRFGITSQNWRGETASSVSPRQNQQGDISSLLSSSPVLQSDTGKPLSEQEILAHLKKQLSLHYMRRVRHSTIEHAGKALLHLSVSDTMDFRFASKAYGLTLRSATKFIISLLHRGFAERRGTRKLYLTPLAMALFPAAAPSATAPQNPG